MKLFPPLYILALLLTGCGQQEQTAAPGVGEVFAGPAHLPIRQDIDTKSTVIATVKHGDRLEVLQRRRRFVRVRTAARAEGWTDDRNLLSTEELSGLRSLSEQSKAAPSQGVATTYETLNVHTEPERLSPSFLQVKEGEKVDVIGHRVTPRVMPRPATPAPAPVAKTKPKKSKKDKKASDVPPPPMPVAPKPPHDWLELSKISAPPSVPEAAPEAKVVPTDDWSLIRNAAGQSGWVLTRRLFMAIPDEVAQYAEGHRIVAYFNLGETRDGKDVKPTWLWTTIDRGGPDQPDFDGIRVFVWSTRKHRYETSYIERNLKGFLPVLTGTVPAPRSKSTKDSSPGAEKAPGFTIVVEKKDGFRYRRHFAFLENRVRLSGEERIENPGQTAPEPNPTLLASDKVPPPAQESFYGSLKLRIRRLFGR